MATERFTAQIHHGKLMLCEDGATFYPCADPVSRAAELNRQHSEHRATTRVAAIERHAALTEVRNAIATRIPGRKAAALRETLARMAMVEIENGATVPASVEIAIEKYNAA